MNKLAQIISVAVATISVGVAYAQTQSEMNDEADHSLLLAQHDLAELIRGYRYRLHGTQREIFDRSQAAWRVYSRAACEFESSGVAGGSVRPMIASVCLETLTRDRIKYMEHLTLCEEGNLNCPVWKKGN